MSCSVYEKIRFWLNYAEVKLFGIITIATATVLGIIHSANIFSSIEKISILFFCLSILISTIGVLPKTIVGGVNFLDNLRNFDEGIEEQSIVMAKIAKRKFYLFNAAFILYVIGLTFYIVGKVYIKNKC